MKKIDLEKERLAFEKDLKTLNIDVSGEWDPDGYYDSDVGECVTDMWNGWLARARYED